MRFITPGSIHHIFNRGVLKMKIFRKPEDFSRFMLKMFEYRDFYKLDLIAFCLMPNHYHFLIQEPENSTDKIVIAKFMQRLQNSHAKYLSLKYKHSGRVFQGVYKNVLIENPQHLKQVIHYIHENPVKKKLVTRAALWPYSSASVYQHLK
jgi:putative transposase